MEMVDYAFAYTKIGWAVLPMEPPGYRKDFVKKPFIKWKEFQTRLPTEEEIRKWWKKWPTAGIGVVTGKISGIVVVDYDSQGAQMLFEQEICPRENTICQRTGGGEGHEQDFFKYPAGGVVGCYTGILKNVDIRGDGGLVVVPPSLHKTGKKYEWDIDPIEMGLNDLCELPQELQNFLDDFDRKKKLANKGESKTGDWANELLFGVDEHSRNSACTRLAGLLLRRNKGDVNAALVALRGWNTRNRPPLDDAEIEKVVRSVASRQGKNELGDKLQLEIERIVFLKSPEGAGEFEFSLKGNTDKLKISPDDLISNTRFRTKFLAVTGRLLFPMKNDDYVASMIKALSEAETKNIDDDYTDRRWILEIIKRQIERPMDNISAIDKSIVVADNSIFLSLHTMVRYINDGAGEKMSRAQIVDGLISIGFKKQILRDENQKQRRVWAMPLFEFTEID